MIVAFDGACKDNGKPYCKSVGAAFWIHGDNKGFRYEYEVPASTNQRGELNGLICALDAIIECKDTEVYIISDSEYIVNTLNKDWLTNWSIKGWKTASGDDVKNKDLWLKVLSRLRAIHEFDIELSVFHIKGHVLSIGPVTLDVVLHKIDGLNNLYNFFTNILANKTYNVDKYDNAIKRFNAINGDLNVEEKVFNLMVAANSVADSMATYKLREITN